MKPVRRQAAGLQPNRTGGRISPERPRTWRRVRAEVGRWAALVVLNLPWCPGHVTNFVLGKAEVWLSEIGR